MIKSRGKTSVKEVGFYDSRTNDYVDPTHVLIPVRVKVKDWLMLFHSGSEQLAKDKEMTGEGFRVLHYAISHVNYENELLVTQADVKEALGMRQQHVSRAFKLLVKKEVLIEGKKQGTSKIYYLNPYFGWKGSARRLKEHLQEQVESKIGQSSQNEVDPSSSSKLGQVA
jgi:Firmicute plasmid replication protein (RepL)